MKLLIDMNLSPEWVRIFRRLGWEALHWSQVGDPRATDATLMSWAREHGFVVFTHDLDFGAILAVTRAEGPSIVQVRTQDVTPSHLASRLLHVMRQYESTLDTGALVTVDDNISRIRILPIEISR